MVTNNKKNSRKRLDYICGKLTVSPRYQTPHGPSGAKPEPTPPCTISQLRIQITQKSPLVTFSIQCSKRRSSGSVVHAVCLMAFISEFLDLENGKLLYICANMFMFTLFVSYFVLACSNVVYFHTSHPVCPH